MHLEMSPLRISALALGFVLALPVPVPAAELEEGELSDGALLDRAPVHLDEAALASLEGRRPGIGKALGQVELSAITYRSDGLRVRGYLAVPRDTVPRDTVPRDAGEGKTGKLPCVIFNRGGNREFGALSDARAAAILAPLAQRGYVAVASQYRGNGGGEGREEFGGAEVADVLALIPLLEFLEEADPSRIGMFGWSRGGLMTYLALRRTDRIRAAIVGAGVSDAFDAIERRPEMETHVLAELVPGWPETRDEALRARSPIFWAGELHKATPVLLLHGSADWRVHPSQALRMASALYEAKHPFRFVFFEGGDHGLSEHRAEVDRLVHGWLDRYVRDGEPWPSLEPHGR